MSFIAALVLSFAIVITPMIAAAIGISNPNARWAGLAWVWGMAGWIASALPAIALQGHWSAGWAAYAAWAAPAWFGAAMVLIEIRKG